MRGIINIKTILIIIFIILLIYKLVYIFKHVESFCTKQMIVFLFSGNSRSSPFAKGNTYSNNILESYNKYIFTEKFKRDYNYKVYISCDNIDLDKTINYFGNNLGNIHLIDTDYYLYDTTNKIKDINIYIDKYNNRNWSSHVKYENSIFQHYKILDSYKLFENNNINCDYIVRLRMDTLIKTDIIELLNKFKDDKLELLMDWDLFAIGKPSIMKVYSTGLDNKYGEYNYKTNIGKQVPVMNDYHDLEKRRWTYAPERQLFEMIFEYYVNKGVDINTTIMSIPKSVEIIRKNEYLIDYS